MPFCRNCGKEYVEGAAFCGGCGRTLDGGNSNPVGTQAPPMMQTPPKSKIAAGLLGIFLGGWGVHNFYLGYVGRAVAQLLLGLILPIVSCGFLWFTPICSCVWGLIEGILILTGSIAVDGHGKPLGN